MTSRAAALARKNGLVTTVSVKDYKKNKEYRFSHLAVIDFESTCWKERHPPPEIIEFPAVLLDLANGCIVDEFHQYLSPTENPVLSDFCKSFTGITQDQVEGGMPLKTSLALFVRWLNDIKTKHSVMSVALATWSDWDFKTCLNNECARKNIIIPDVFNDWIDLRAIYREHTKKPSRGLKTAVETMGLTFQGRAHSGICDARNTAMLAARLYQDGANIRITSHIVSEQSMNA